MQLSSTDITPVGGDKVTYLSILDFWFNELTPEQWYIKSSELDEVISKRFGRIYLKATKGELYSWRSDMEGRVAEIIILDQFSRNLNRDSPEAFVNDAMALVLAQEIVALGMFDKISELYQNMVLLPYMHSESTLIHDQALQIAEKYNLDTTYEILHKNIIDQFGRYPHRNAILGRQSTREEIEFLKQDNSSF